MSEKTIYKAMDKVGRQERGDPIDVVERAIENVTTVLEVRSRRVGGANYQVPIDVRPRRATNPRRSLDRRLLPPAPREDDGRAGGQRGDGRLFQGVGATEKRREDLQKMAQSSKAFAHYRW